MDANIATHSGTATKGWVHGERDGMRHEEKRSAGGWRDRANVA